MNGEPIGASKDRSASVCLGGFPCVWLLGSHFSQGATFLGMNSRPIADGLVHHICVTPIQALPLSPHAGIPPKLDIFYIDILLVVLWSTATQALVLLSVSASAAAETESECTGEK